MSFVKVGRPQQQGKGKRPFHPKKVAAAPKREWVGTVNDLSVHKLTPAELNHRHEIHKSQNKTAAQWELREKALQRRLRHPGSPAPLDHTSLSIIREVFSDQLLLQDVLARSDRAMAVVKDLFGDAPRRQTGHPSVTKAPDCDCDSALPVLQRPDPPTELSLLSQSMMDQQALNELEASDQDYSDEDTTHVIKRANVRKMKGRSRGRLLLPHKIHCPICDQEDREHVPSTPCTSGRAPDQTALNATVAVKRVRSRRGLSEDNKEEPSVLVTQVLNPEMPLNQSGMSSRTRRSRKCVSHSAVLDGSSVTSLGGDQSSLGLLQAMLGQVERDLETLSPDTETYSAESPKPHRNQSLTGFSVGLVSIIGRLVNLLKQSEEESRRAAEERRRTEEMLKEQRGLIDALTAETMTLREEAAARQAGVQQRTEELEQKLDTVVLVMGGLGLLEAHADPPQDSDVKATVCQSAAAAEQGPVPPAVLLSPPCQRDNWQQIPAAPPIALHKDLPPVDVLPCRRCAADDINISAFSLTSLPLSSLPSTSSMSLSPDPISSQISPGAMLAEITELRRQNHLVKAQLTQARSLAVSGVRGGGGGGWPSSTDGQKSWSSGSTGRVTTQRFVERRGSVSSSSSSSSSGRRSRQGTTAEGDQQADQGPSPNHSIVSSVEQRLLELNRQSAAARGRLLELIDQQKRSVSPSHSPIPRSAFSPHSAGGSPELLAAQDILFQTGGAERRSAGSAASSPSLGRETGGGQSKMEKPREREGWFSLSAHVR